MFVFVAGRSNYLKRSREKKKKKEQRLIWLIVHFCYCH